jgi:hypothetical protein
MECEQEINEIDFSITLNGWANLAYFDDTFLNMQGINIGVTDQIITQWEYDLLEEFIVTETTPESFVAISAFSQMWIFSLYELLRLWRDRRFQMNNCLRNGGLDLEINNLIHNNEQEEDNIVKMIRKKQIEKFKDNISYREKIESDWLILEPLYRDVELLRMNLAKHVPPGKNKIYSPMPGYGRINFITGSIDFEVISSDKEIFSINRRYIADHLRIRLKDIKQKYV